MSVGSNIWKLFAIKALRGNMLFMPTIVLFFQDNGLTMMEIFLLQTIFSVAIVTLEIPSGYFADRFGRKNALVVGATCAFLSFVIYAASYDFWMMLAAELALGIGYAFVSGADAALLYESLEDVGRASAYRRFEGYMQSIYTFSEAAASIVGGYLALLSLRIPLVAQAVVAFFLIPLTLALREPEHKHTSTEVKMWSMRRVFVEAMHRNKYLRWLIAYYAVLSTAGLVVVWFRQPYFALLEIPLEYYGYLWAALMLVVSFANLSADSVARLVGERSVFYLIGTLGILAFAILGSAPALWVLSAFALLALMRGLLDPIVSHHIQREAASEVRATVLSVRSFVARGLFAVLGPLAGWVSDVYTLQIALIGTGICFAAFALVTAYLLLRNDPTIRAAA